MEPLKIILLIVIFLYTRPLWIFRYKFRSIVYNDKSWKINFRPVFWQEIKALLSNKYFKKKEMKIANGYRVYLIGFLLLWFLYSNL
ncbi:hypothetical protein JW930_01960 [Candidatus Woesearchaeota archaeon]|nr:hypothetical protein [Candidatus Woesearchaeota archaeon]